MSEECAEEREANAMMLRENYRKVYSWTKECERFRRIIENVMKGEFNVFLFAFIHLLVFIVLLLNLGLFEPYKKE